MKHIMIDLETMGTIPGSAILSCGAVAFDPFTGEIDTENTFYRNISIDSNLKLGMKIAGDTLEWWLAQNSEALKMLFEDSIVVSEFLSHFTNWWGRRDGIFPWSHGASFDITLLETMFRMAKEYPGGSKLPDFPWKFWDVRDTRTIFHAAWPLAGKPQGITREGTHHNALDDAIYQAQCVVEAFKILGVKR